MSLRMSSTVAAETAAKTSTSGITQDPQRELLARLTLLSVQCAGEEQRIEQEHGQKQGVLADDVQRARSANEEKRTHNLDAINHKRDEKLARIVDKVDADGHTLEQTTAQTRQQIDHDKDAADEQAKRQVDQAKWLAESVLEAIGAQIEVEDRKAKETLDARKVELEQIRSAAVVALNRYEQAPVGAEPLGGEEISKRMAEDSEGLYAECRDKAEAATHQLATLGTPRMVSGGTPYMVGMLACAAAGGLVQFAFADTSGKVISAASAVVVALIASGIWTMRMKKKARQEVVAVFVPLTQYLELGQRASDAAYKAGDDVRNQREREERRKCAHEVDAARDRTKPLQRQAHEKRVAAMAELDAWYNKTSEELKQWRAGKIAELEEMHANATAAADAAYQHEKQRVDEEEALRSRQMEAEYTRQSQELLERWNSGLAKLTGSLSNRDVPPAAPLDWNSPQWEQWTSPKVFNPAVPFGRLEIDLETLTTTIPKRLSLPHAFSIPAVLALPERGSVLIETDHASRGDAITTAGLMMARLLTHVPAGRVKFTIIDPVGLGQSFAGFMHLADHDESLIGSRIWTETEHIEQRLADLTEHMETVIQKYLRNEYATIDQYNAQAGELAEPLRYLVICDFPTAFETEALRRLASIATSGARCGVYTIIIRDTRQPLPQGSRYEELVGRSIHLKYKEHRLSWEDAVFARFPLTLDAPPEEKALTAVMDRVGRAAKAAKRVEVPFTTIIPPKEKFWSASSRDDLKVPIGKSGATRLQSLRLGVGVAQHALIAGKTGSGKSNLMHTIVTNMAMWYSPDEVEFYLVDFKKGVEFKAYATRQLPHARAIAVESDREFGLSVLQRVDAELTRRGEMFRAAGVQEISAYRKQTGKILPRTVLLIDEFQEFFSEDDKLGQEAALLLDRLVRQGRAFGVHVVLGSQTIGGSSGLSRSTMGQMAVRVALQCSEADSQMILGDNNSAARLLNRPGEAIYNDAGGLVEANSPFQIAFLPDEQRDAFLRKVQELSNADKKDHPVPVVFEGNAPADIHKNVRLMNLLHKPSWGDMPHAVPAWIGEPVSIKDPSAVIFRRQSGSNSMLVGQQDELAVSVMASMMVSVAAQCRPEETRMVVMDGTPADSSLTGLLQRVVGALPLKGEVVAYRGVDAAIIKLGEELDAREADPEANHAPVYVFVYGVQRFRMLRKQEEEFSFARGEEAPKPKTDKVFARLITEGPALGMHLIVWADTAVTLDRTFDRAILREFDNRILFQMSATDSSNLIDSPTANKLGTFRALAYSEELGTAEKFRPYQLPGEQWLAEVSQRLGRS